jgi:integrase
VDLRRRWAIFPQTKNGESRGVPLVAAVVAELEKLPRVKDSELVFAWDMTRTWRTALRRAGLENFRFHDLRHSAASMLVQSGANLSEVAQLLGQGHPDDAALLAHPQRAHPRACGSRDEGHPIMKRKLARGDRWTDHPKPSAPRT